MPSVADQLAQVFARPIAHRGLHGCGRGGPIENTITAALAAIAGGYAIECDVRLTRDGEAMVFHDDTLDRLTGRAGRFEDHGATEIATFALEDGSLIPTLPDFLASIAGRVPVIIEVKSAENGAMRLAATVLGALRDYDGPVALESFEPTVISSCRSAACPIGLVGRNAGEPVAPHMLPRCDFLSWNIDHIARVARDHPDLPRSAWTVRTPAQRHQAEDAGAQMVFEGFRP